MYAETAGTIRAEDGTEFGLTVKHVDIDPEVAKIVFDAGYEVGDWHWKHKVWFCTCEADLALVQAAARYYYGWADGTERIDVTSGSIRYEAWYAC